MAFPIWCIFAGIVGSHADSSVVEQFLTTDFTIIESVDSFPSNVSTSLVMANPGGRFNVTDAIDDVTLPFQRLLFGGRSDSLWFIYYEQGGIGYSRNLVIFRCIGSIPSTLWAGWTQFDPVENILDLKTAIRRCVMIEFHDPNKRKLGKNSVVVMPAHEFNDRLFRK
jgi:hypothetical protein